MQRVCTMKLWSFRRRYTMAEFILPYRSGSVTLTSRFGWRTLNGVQGYHKGVDLCGTDKTLVSPCDGVVKSSTIITDKSNTTWEWGNYIRIDRADGLQIFMCHMASRKVQVGQTVKAGDVVGIEGNTGPPGWPRRRSRRNRGSPRGSLGTRNRPPASGRSCRAPRSRF